jgi:RsiW-degrading membrane proteinase PrsW (M82 family)
MTTDLHMPSTSLKYNTAVTIFFIPYTLLEVPSNIILKKMRPSYWMAILMFFWGTVMTLMGLVNSYGGLLVGRFFLGVTEVSSNESTCTRTRLTLQYRLDSSLPQRFF